MARWEGKNLRNFALPVLAIFVILGLCLGRPDYREETRIRNYADPIVAQMLTALSEDNYAEFSEQFDPHLQAALTEADFHRFSQNIKESYGEYQSHSFYSVISYPEVNVVKYIAQFSKVSIGLDVTVEFSSAAGPASVHDFSIVQAGWLTR